MKKLLLLATLVLGVVSCMKDQPIEAGLTGDGNIVLSVGLPADATRAAGTNSALGAIDNGLDLTKYDIRYILEVFDANNTLAKRLENYEDDATETTFELRLIPGRHYSFVVWADFVERNANGEVTLARYDVTSLREVYPIGAHKAMDESRDAYTAVFNTADEGEVFSSASKISMTLKRPFAKLRVVTNDIDEIYSELQSAKIEYTVATYQQFDALTKAASEPSLVTKSVNYTKEAYLYDGEPTTEGEQTLFADYLLGTETGSVQFVMTITDNVETLPAIAFNTNIPVERNHLTTIYGPVLTDFNKVTVSIDDNFDQPEHIVEHKKASTAEQLNDIFTELNESTTDEEVHIVLGDDINLDDLASLFTTRASSSTSITIASGKEVVLDIKNYSITGTDNETASFGLFNIQPGAKLTIEGTTGKIQLTAKNNRGWNAYSSVISNQRGEFVLNGGTIEHLGGTDMAYGLDILTNTGAGDAKATINGGVVKSTYRAIRQFLNSTKATAELVVNGGTIEGLYNKSIWMQNANNSVNPGKLVVSENANLYGDVMVSGAGAPELDIELSVAVEALKDGATVIPSNIPAGYAIYVKNNAYVVEKGVEENGNEISICNAAGLKYVADKVNSGADYFAGKTIVLANDIDLNNEEWAPIGSATKDHGFMGNFDGRGYAIKNLTIKNITPDSDGYVYGGLFGVTEGVDKDNQNSIKNLTIENVDIELGGHIVAAAIAYPYYTNVENITVKGNISIKGGNYTSGVLAYTRRCVDAKNISIVGNNGSVIEGGVTVGGVISDIQTNGGLVVDYSDFKAENLTIKGTKSVGGISGIIGAQNLDGAIVKNVTIVSDDIRTGMISGSFDGVSVITNAVVENVTGADYYIGCLYSGTASDRSSVTINGDVYTYNNGWWVNGCYVVSTADELVEALEAGKDVYLFNDIKIDPANMSNAYGKTGINVKYGQTINGGGHTLNIKGAGGTWDSGINTTGGLIKDITITGSFRGIFINHTSTHSEKVVLENVTIGGNGTVYTISCDQGLYQGIEATNCTFNGWTSFAKTAGEAKFVNCNFGEGSGYKYCRPYSNTEFVGCTFCPGYAVDDSIAKVTFTDCTWEE